MEALSCLPPVSAASGNTISRSIPILVVKDEHLLTYNFLCSSFKFLLWSMWHSLSLNGSTRTPHSKKLLALFNKLPAFMQFPILQLFFFLIFNFQQYLFTQISPPQLMCKYFILTERRPDYVLKEKWFIPQTLYWVPTS